MLSKKYYIEFAEIIGKSTTYDELRDRLIAFFIQDNYRFDVSRFNDAIKAVKEAEIEARLNE